MSDKVPCYISRHTSGLDELTRKQQRDVRSVLYMLKLHGRFSVFEATANDDIGRTLGKIMKMGLATTTPLGYPWTHVDITDVGEAFLLGESNVHIIGVASA